MTPRKPWLVLPDQLSNRVFFDAGIVRGLSERLEGGPTAVFLVPRAEAADWAGRLEGGSVLHGEDLTATGNGLGERSLRRADAWLDRRIGYHPLAIRLNQRHSFSIGFSQGEYVGNQTGSICGKSFKALSTSGC
jgi:hypothetical protein